MNPGRYRIDETPDQLAGCTWTSPEGRVFLELPHAMPWYYTAAGSTLYQGIEQGMNPDYDFIVKAICAVIDVPVTLIQIQWPDGRFLSNPGLPMYDFIGTGLRGWVLENPELIQRGEKIKLQVDNSANASAVNLDLFFEGLLRIPMVNQ